MEKGVKGLNVTVLTMNIDCSLKQVGLHQQ